MDYKMKNSLPLQDDMLPLEVVIVKMVEACRAWWSMTAQALYLYDVPEDIIISALEMGKEAFDRKLAASIKELVDGSPHDAQ